MTDSNLLLVSKELEDNFDLLSSFYSDLSQTEKKEIQHEIFDLSQLKLKSVSVKKNKYRFVFFLSGDQNILYLIGDLHKKYKYKILFNNKEYILNDAVNKKINIKKKEFIIEVKYVKEEK